MDIQESIECTNKMQTFKRALNVPKEMRIFKRALNVAEEYGHSGKHWMYQKNAKSQKSIKCCRGLIIYV